MLKENQHKKTIKKLKSVLINLNHKLKLMEKE